MNKLLLFLCIVFCSILNAQNNNTIQHHHKQKNKTIQTAQHSKHNNKHSNKHSNKHKPKMSNTRAANIELKASIASIPKAQVKAQPHTNIPNDYENKDAIKSGPRLYSYSAIAVNADTGEIFVSKNPDTKLPIASLTKLMTAMVVLDSGVNLDDYVTISTSDIDTLRNTRSRLKVGMQLRRRDLLLLALMSSENRAAHALGRTTYSTGGLGMFVDKMNEKAKSLGMENTQFFDPTGLTNRNRSTAMDLAKMVQSAYSYNEIRKYTTTKNANVMFSPKYIHHYINTDALVRGNQMQIEVSKTGFISEAGHCLALYSIINNKPIVMVFLNSAGKSGRLIDAMTIKNYVKKIYSS